jgi:multidrug resistance protein, MATE family
VAPPASFRTELRQLVRLALPLAFAQAGQALMGVVDVAVLGRAGPVLLGGAGLGNALFFGIGILGMGVMHGLDPLISQARGAGDPVRARRLVWQGLWLALFLSAVLALPIAVAPALLHPLGVQADVAREAGRFLAWRLPGLPVFLVFFAPRAFLQSTGRIRPLVAGVVIANLVNLGLDVLLVFGGAGLPAWAGPLRALPALGVVGSAWATNLASAAQVLVLGLSLRALPAPAGSRAFAPPDLRALRQVLRVGLPAGLHMFAEVSFFALASLLAGRLGPLPLAAHQVALQYASLTFTAAVGLGNAGSVRVGLAVGAGDAPGARRAGLAALSAGSAFMALNGLVLLLFPGPVARLLTDDPGVIATAVPLLRIAAVFQVSDGLQGVGAGVLRGAGETRFTFLANMVAYWVVGLPLLLLLSFRLGMGVAGMWLGFVAALTVVAASLVTRFLRISSREIAPLAGGAAG